MAGDVVGQILDRVKSGELKVGDVLPGERVLAAQMDVSRPTVSAAMGRLAEAGVLKSRPGRQGNAEIISIWIPEGLHEAAGGVGELGSRRYLPGPRGTQDVGTADRAACRVPSHG